MIHNKQKRFMYFLTGILLVILEIFIALYVHDNFIRPFIGDVIIVVVIYCFTRTIIPEKVRLLPVYIFLFAASVEFSQYFKVLELFGLEENKLARIIFGSTFDWFDILCYGIGCFILIVFERIIMKR